MSARCEGALFVILAVSVGAFLEAQSPDQGPVFTISGTSTVRSWSCPARGSAKVVPGKTAQPVPGFPTGIQALTIMVPVNAIACEDAVMTDHVRVALKEKTSATIAYQLGQYELSGNTAKAAGKLTIAGVTRPVNLDVRFEPSGGGLRATGETTIDMTQFGVAPPEIWEGLLKVGKEVRVRFETLLQPVP
jgi:hypothetical protein